MKTKSECAAVRLEKSRLLAALAVLAVAFVVLAAVPAVVDDSDAAGEAKEVKSLDELKNGVSTDQFNLKLTTDITLDSVLTIEKNGSLDLNEKKITCAKPATKTEGSYTLRVQTFEVSISNGTIEFTADSSKNDAAGGAVRVDSKLTLTNVTVNSTEYGVFAATNGTAIVRNCNIVAGYGAVTGNGTQSNAVIDVDGGTYTSTKSVVAFFPSTETLNIRNATLTGVGGIDVRAGKTTLENVTINLKGASSGVGNSGPADFNVGIGIYQWATNESYGTPEVNLKKVTINVADGSTKACDVYYGSLTGGKDTFDGATKLTAAGRDAKLSILDNNGEQLFKIDGQSTFAASSVKIDLTSNAGKLGIMKDSVLNCNITAGEDPSNKATFQGIKAASTLTISVGSIVIEGDYTTDASGNITVTGDTKVNGNLTIEPGVTLTVDENATLTVNGKVIVKERIDSTSYAGKVVVNGTLDIGEKGSLVVGGDVEADGHISNSGTIVISNKDATIPVDKISGTGDIDNSEIAEDGTIGGNWNTVTTFTQNQTITLTSDTVLKAGSQIIFEGVLVIPADITLTIEDGAQLIVKNATGKILNDGNIVVMSDAKNSEAPSNVTWDTTNANDGGLQNFNGNIINNGIIALDYSDDSEIPKETVFYNTGILINAGDITVGQQSYFEAASGAKNQGTISINGMFRGNIDNESVVIVSGIIADDVKINNKADGASVQLVSAIANDTNKTIVVSNGLSFTNDPKKSYNGESKTSINVMKNFSVGGLTITSTVIKNDDELTVGVVEYGKYNVLVGTMAITQVADYDSPALFTDMFTLDAQGNTYVAESLSVPAGIVLSINSSDSYTGTFAVDGDIVTIGGKISYTITTNGTTSTSTASNSIGGATIDEETVLKIDGSLTSSAKFTTASNINAVYYEIAATTNPVADAKHVYTTFIPAIESGALKITIYGKNTIPTDITIPSGVTVSVDGILTVSKDSTVSVADGAKMSGSKVIVNGTLYFATYKTGDKLNADSITSEVIIQGDKDRTYTNLAGAISKAVAGATITLRGTATIDSDLTIPEGIEVDTDGNDIEIGRNATLTVDGELFLNGLASKVTLALEGEFDKAGAIAVNGTISSTDDIEGKILKNNAVHIIPGAYYEITVKTTTTYYVSPVENAATIIATVDDQTIAIAGEKLTIGDVSFIGTDDGATIIVDTALTATSITLDNAELSINGKKVSLVITNSVGTVDLKGTATTGFKVSSSGADDSKKLAVEGTFIVDPTTGSKDKMDISGTVFFNNSAVNKMTVSGTAIVADGKRLDVTSSLTVTGTVQVSKNATLDSDGLAEIQGSIVIAQKSADEPSYGTFSAEKLYIGTTKNATIGAGASVIGNTDVSNMLVAAAGTTVPEAFTSEDSTYEKTEYYVDNGLYMTVYAPADIPIAIDGMKASKDNAKYDGWTTVDGDIEKKVKTSDHIGDKPKVYALFDYNIYMITLTVGSGIENVAIDGNLVVGKEITGLKAGTHTITYTLENNYSGTATLTVNGEKQSGMTFSMSGKDYNKKVDGVEYVNYDLQLFGVSASGYPPVAPVTPSEDKDDGLSLTDILLIVLVVLIVIMAVIVAMRLMRS